MGTLHASISLIHGYMDLLWYLYTESDNLLDIRKLNESAL